MSLFRTKKSQSWGPLGISAVIDSFYSPFMTEKEVHCQISKSADNTKLFHLDRCHNSGEYLTKLRVRASDGR